ncbi:MAG: YraN family protein [Candidatus Sericytochromatia bacterium]
MSTLSELNRRQLGLQGETIARQWLESLGYQCLAQNVYTRQGELDLVMKEGTTLVFVEVKFRRSLRHGQPLEAITPTKQRHLLQAARYFLHKYPHSGPIRFDALGIQRQANGELQFTHIKNAIQND